MSLFAALAGYFYNSDASSDIPEKDGGVTAPPSDNRSGGPPAGGTPGRPSDEEMAAALGMPAPVPEPVPPPDRPSDEEAMAALGMPPPADSDAAQGGGTVTDPPAAKAAADRAKDAPKQSDLATKSNRTLPKIRGFTDQTFILMHAMNLINLRNETALELEDIAETPSEDNDIITNTVRSLKHELPYAYLPTDSNAKEQNAIIQCYGEPSTFKSYMTAQPGYQSYLNSTTETLSTLVPKIRIYKLFGKPTTGYVGDTGLGEQLVEYVFETSGMGTSDLEDMMASRGAKRGYGVGIKSFDIALVQGNPIIAPTVVQGTLVLYAGGMEDLLKPRTGNTAASKHLSYRFIELAFAATGERVLNSTVNTPQIGSLDDFNFQLVFDVGVVANSNALGLDADFSSLSMKMGPVGHNFDIAEDGSITLTIELDGRIENKFRQQISFDVLSTADSLTHDLYSKFGSDAVKRSCTPGLAADFRSKQTSIANSKYKERLTLLNDLLRDKGKIYYVNIPSKTLEAYNEAFNAFEETANPDQPSGEGEDKIVDPLTAGKIKAGYAALKNALSPYIPEQEEEAENSSPRNHNFSVTSSEFNKKQAEKIEKDMEDKPKEEQTAIRDCAIDPNSTQVAYFYVGDLINVILENMSDIYTETKINAIVGDAVSAVKAEVSHSDVARVVTDLKRRAEDFRRYRAVLGPVLINDFFSEQKIMCSIGDIPIALNHFNAWLAGSTEGKDRSRYPLFDFMNEFLTEYVRSFLMGDAGYFDEKSLGALMYIESDTIMGYGSNNPENDTDPLTLHRTSYGGRKGLLYESVPEIDRPLIRTKPNVFLATSRAQAYDYHIFYDAAGSYCLPTTPENMEKAGINVYQQGKDTGILKTIQFQKHDTDGIRTMKIMNAITEGSDETASQIMEMFDATVTTFPNLQVFIGEKMYIAPQSVTPYLSKETLETFPNFKGLYNLDRLGIGGFYTVNQVHHSFGVGQMETKIICIQDGMWMKDRRDEARLKAQEEADAAAKEAADEAAKLSALGGVFSDDALGALDALANTGNDTMDAIRTMNTNNSSEITQEPITGAEACKLAFGEGPEGPQSETRALAESFTGMMAVENPQNLIAYAKGLLDNATGPARKAIEQVLGLEQDDTSNSDDSPAKGNQSTGNNGPVTTA